MKKIESNKSREWLRQKLKRQKGIKKNREWQRLRVTKTESDKDREWQKRESDKVESDKDRKL